MSEWINMMDCKPMEIQGNTVLGFGEGHIFECVYDDGYWCNIEGCTMTHWKMLPEFPKD